MSILTPKLIFACGKKILERHPQLAETNYVEEHLSGEGWKAHAVGALYHEALLNEVCNEHDVASHLAINLGLRKFNRSFQYYNSEKLNQYLSEIRKYRGGRSKVFRQQYPCAAKLEDSTNKAEKLWRETYHSMQNQSFSDDVKCFSTELGKELDISGKTLGISLIKSIAKDLLPDYTLNHCCPVNFY